LKGRRWNRPKDRKRREDIVVEIGGKDQGMKLRFAMKGVKERIDLSAPPSGHLAGWGPVSGKVVIQCQSAVHWRKETYRVSDQQRLKAQQRDYGMQVCVTR
jgi:hypothetical protein